MSEQLKRGFPPRSGRQRSIRLADGSWATFTIHRASNMKPKPIPGPAGSVKIEGREQAIADALARHYGAPDPSGNFVPGEAVECRSWKDGEWIAGFRFVAFAPILGECPFVVKGGEIDGQFQSYPLRAHRECRRPQP